MTADNFATHETISPENLFIFDKFLLMRIMLFICNQTSSLTFLCHRVYREWIIHLLLDWKYIKRLLRLIVCIANYATVER